MEMTNFEITAVSTMILLFAIIAISNEVARHNERKYIAKRDSLTSIVMTGLKCDICNHIHYRKVNPLSIDDSIPMTCPWCDRESGMEIMKENYGKED